MALLVEFLASRELARIRAGVTAGPYVRAAARCCEVLGFGLADGEVGALCYAANACPNEAVRAFWKIPPHTESQNSVISDFWNCDRVVNGRLEI